MALRELSKRELEEAEALGGAEDILAYLLCQELNYCDKSNHKERSLFHAPQHSDHWKKEAKKEVK